MDGVRIEGWRGSGGVAQCHRCQAYGHSSYGCHNTPRCVRCAGEHVVADCPRTREEPATCINCGKPHAANYRHCPIYRRVARSKNIPIKPPPPPTRVSEPTAAMPSRAERRRRQRPEEDEQSTATVQSTESPIPTPEVRRKSKRGGRIVKRRRLAAMLKAQISQISQLAAPKETASNPMSADDEAIRSLPTPSPPPRNSIPVLGCYKCGQSTGNFRREVTQLTRIVGSLFNYIQAIAAGHIDRKSAAAEVEAFARAWSQQMTQDDEESKICQTAARDGRP